MEASSIPEGEPSLSLASVFVFFSVWTFAVCPLKSMTAFFLERLLIISAVANCVALLGVAYFLPKG